MICFTFILNILLSLAAADGALTEASLIKTFPKEPLLNEIVIFEPVDKHKFNLEAQNFCGNGHLIAATEKAVKCQMSAPGSSELQLYVCDEKKTYCRREELAIKTQQPSGLLGWLKYYKKAITDRDSWSAPQRTDVSAMPLVKGFVNGNISNLKEVIKKQKKPALLYFTQASCAPCREFKEITLNSDEFQQASQEYGRYQVDVDTDMPAELRERTFAGTPTIIVMTMEFKEVGRFIGGSAPGPLALWLKNLPKSSVETLAEKPLEKLSDDEKFRVGRWQQQHGNEEWISKSKQSFKAIQKPTPYMQLVSSYQDLPEVLQAQLEWVHNNETKALHMDGPDADLAKNIYLAAVEDLTYSSSAKKEKKIFSQIVPFVQRLETLIQKNPDVTEKNWQIFDLAFGMKHACDKLDLKTESKVWKGKALAALDVLLKLPQIPPRPFLAALRAEIADDAVTKEKVIADLRSENKDDYAYDLFAAYDAKEKKDLTGALAEIDKSLAVAKNRSWQKAIFLKISLLRELKRSDEALSLIDDTLSKTQLPGDPSFPIHRFVQKLRREQSEIGEIK
jgi:hypothetical protein